MKKDNFDSIILVSIPCLINGYLPEMEGLPLLIYKLANINYENDEMICFSEIAYALANFYLPSMEEEEEEEENKQRIERTLRSLIFPALRNKFLPNSELGEYIKELTSTSQAFKHFGRFNKYLN
ncbi:Mlh1_C domain-containing protein [Meloidogyne graminicola]|uniref:Mlh1_C domain-containing protein n=1 Tax=Meloidogyne graminicola TaxID=189291 RepID=A0A8S9ZHQ0_9BILA|nr:Mlh1_C domain-containing protein [Meloidogyne graminicola]